jgi:hypothetical protein
MQVAECSERRINGHSLVMCMKARGTSACKMASAYRSLLYRCASYTLIVSRPISLSLADGLHARAQSGARSSNRHPSPSAPNNDAARVAVDGRALFLLLPFLIRIGADRARHLHRRRLCETRHAVLVPRFPDPHSSTAVFASCTMRQRETIRQ